MDLNEIEAVGFFDQVVMEYKEGSNRIQKRLPKVMKNFHHFTDSCFTEGEISGKHKQLMALGISIANHDEYCIVYHTKGALQYGATEQEIMEVIALSAALGGGSALSQGVTLTLDTFDYFHQQMKQANPNH